MKTSKHVSGIKLIDNDLDSNPVCSHGPTLLFETKDLKKYFSCSSCRFVKDCNIHITYDNWMENEDSIKKKLIDKNVCKQTNAKYFYDKSIFDLNQNQRYFCTNCSLIISKQQINEHKRHDLVSNISQSQLTEPTKLLNSLTDNKFQAQYLFSDKTIDFLINEIIVKNKFESVISIGCPTIHEYIESNSNKLNVKSILLDIDERFKQFYTNQKYLNYNLFNNYFFDGIKAEKTFENFLQNSKKDSLIIIIDPPFGGLIEAINKTFVKINEMWKSVNQISDSQDFMPMMLFFPYFNENRITNTIKSLSMSDFMVDYENHNKYTEESGRKFGSPVRIFTNIPLSTIVLPKSQGYHYCDYCCKYVFKNNNHCFECETCTSKDGKPYKHCYTCKRCVKFTWNHCKQCAYCHLNQESCGRSTDNLQNNRKKAVKRKKRK